MKHFRNILLAVKCPCPVWLVPCEAPKAYRRTLAAVDVDDSYAGGSSRSGRR